MHYEDLFYTLCGKYNLLLYINIYFIGKLEEDHPNDTDPKDMATFD